MVSEVPDDTAGTSQSEEDTDSEETDSSEPASIPASVPQEDPEAKARQELLDAQRVADAKYAATMKPVEDQVAEWDFAASWQASEEIAFEDPELEARLESRRDEIRRYAILEVDQHQAHLAHPHGGGAGEA